MTMMTDRKGPCSLRTGLFKDHRDDWAITGDYVASEAERSLIFFLMKFRKFLP